MNDENFIKPIQKKSSSQLPAVTSSQAPAPPEYDPIKRLTNELSHLNQNYQQVTIRLERLEQRQDRAEQRPQAATLADVQDLASKIPPLNLNAEKFAKHVQPALVATLPSAEQLQATAQAAAGAITDSGTAAAEQIRRAGADAASQIEQATVASKQKVLGLMGFQSWKQAVWLCFIPLLVAGASLTGFWVEYQKGVKLEKQLAAYKACTKWIEEKYPKVWEVYKKANE